MSTGQQCCGGVTAGSTSEFGVELTDGKQPEGRMTAADAVYMTATVTAVVLLLISVF